MSKKISTAYLNNQLSSLNEKIIKATQEVESSKSIIQEVQQVTGTMDDFFAYIVTSTVTNITSDTIQSDSQSRVYDLNNTKIKRIQLDADTTGNAEWKSGSYSIKVSVINQSGTIVVLDTTTVPLGKNIHSQNFITLLNDYLAKNCSIQIDLITYAETNFSFNPVSATTTATCYIQIERNITG